MASAVIGALRVSLGIDSAAFSNGLKKAESSLQKFGNLAKKGLAAAGVAAAGAATAMGLMVRNSINAADEMSKAAQKFGIPIEELSRLKYAADLSGVSFNALGTGVRRLSQNMNDASKGVGEGAEAFKQLGISVTGADGNLKSSSAILAEMADKFAAMPDGAEKTALAMDLMGRSGADMIPLLNGGAAALQNLMTQADTFGQVFSAEMGASAEAFNDNISRLQGAFGNLAARIATDLLPHLERFSAWLVENAPAIQQWATTILGAFVRFGQDLAQLKTEIDAIIAAFQAFRDAVTARVAEIDATLRAWSAEIVGIFAAIPGQMYQIGVNIIQGLWDGMKSLFGSVRESLGGFVGGAIDYAKSIAGIQSPSTVMAEVGRNLMQGLVNGMSSMAGTVSGSTGGIVGSIEQAFSGIGDSIAQAINGTKEWRDVLKDVLAQIAKIALSGLGQAGGFGGFLSSLLGGLVGFARGGTIMPGGAGGIDSQIVAFRKSPNERVDITKPGQDIGGGAYAPVYNIDARGADQAAITRLERGLRERDRNFGKMVDQRNDVRQTRKTRG